MGFDEEVGVTGGSLYTPVLNQEIIDHRMHAFCKKWVVHAPVIAVKVSAEAAMMKPRRVMPLPFEDVALLFIKHPPIVVIAIRMITITSRMDNQPGFRITRRLHGL